jgi:hypothetical protein
VAVYGFFLFDAWVESYALVPRQLRQRAPSTRKYEPFGHEAFTTHAALVFDSLQPKGHHLNLRDGSSRDRASHGSCALKMQGTVHPPVASGVLRPLAPHGYSLDPQ